jgi:asparagine synthase (glutamine-hydrolysing)
MCGIAGWVNFGEDISEKTGIINSMANTLKRRGPDEGAFFREKHILMAHRRLVVVDPEGGKQPMTFSKFNRSATNRRTRNSFLNFNFLNPRSQRNMQHMMHRNDKFTIVYNGELYNTLEVRRELILAGYKFLGHSDTEVILKAYVHWREECLQRLNGIFAFAVWESKAQRLFLARDRIGVKPLFFCNEKNGIIFGSEIKTLLAHPSVEPQIEKNEGLRELFFLGPSRRGGFGIFKNIKELKPGEYLLLSKERRRVVKYWSFKAKEFRDSHEKTIEKLRFLISDSIKRQLVSDRPLCCFLSGGLDSSIISKFSSDYYKLHKRGKLCTYSVDYIDNEKYFAKNAFQPNTDSEYIKIMTDFIESDHRNVVIDNIKLAQALDLAVLAKDCPSMADIDSSLLLFCKEVKKDFTVALSGECADEIFGGYPWYHNKEILFEDCFPWSRSLAVRKSILRQDLFENSEEYVKVCYKESVKETDILPGDSKIERRMREMFRLNTDWFMQTLLDRKDRMSMFSGLEVRVPFCDYRIMEYAYNMPWNIKCANGREKGIVREAMKGILPDEIINRKKSPYPKTFNPIYFKTVSERVRAILEDKSAIINNFLDKNGVLNVIERPEQISSPWYGQLMRAPQILAYIIEIDYWFKNYNVQILG